MKPEYIQIGTCIWCQKSKPEVTFNNKPHTISRKIGSTNIGFDICDSCNIYFGTRDIEKKYPMSVELAFKEILNLTRYLMPDDSGKPSIKKGQLKSIYFEYYRSQGIIRIKNKFRLQKDFIEDFTRQFKRGIYEAFLQEYHLKTTLGLDQRFDRIRRFVRYDIGNLPLYIADNRGIYLLPENRDDPALTFNDHLINHINNYGFYTFWIFGHMFYLEVTTKAEISRELYLKSEANRIGAPGFVYSGIKEIKYITDVDFALTKLYNHKI